MKHELWIEGHSTFKIVNTYRGRRQSSASFNIVKMPKKERMAAVKWALRIIDLATR